MHNDADGAVPWYQGIELFTAMRRLGKQVWMLNYNGEAHNLRERRNQKDISIREQQYFDWLLKGETPPKWIKEGVISFTPSNRQTRVINYGYIAGNCDRLAQVTIGSNTYTIELR